MLDHFHHTCMSGEVAARGCTGRLSSHSIGLDIGRTLDLPVADELCDDRAGQRLTCDKAMRKLPQMPPAIAPAGSGGNTSRMASVGYL